MKVCVLLSTYNGEKFLEEQLESIILQEGIDPIIYVRDDGSTDRTCNILDKWRSKNLLDWYKGDNLGFALSFIDLMTTALDCDYYAFCDQDDIWLPHKLKKAVDILETIDDSIKLYCSNVDYYKDGKRLGPIHKSAPYFDIYKCLLRNIAPGCSMVFSRGLRNLIISTPPKNIIAHDFWIYQVAALHGTIHYDFESSMLYRQHENNKIGQKNKKKEIWSRRLRNLFSCKFKHEREDHAKELLRCHMSSMPEISYDAVFKVAEYRKSLLRKMSLIFDGRYTMGTFSGDLFLALRILFSRL